MNNVNQNTITVSKNDTAILALEVTLDHDVTDLTDCTCRLVVKQNVADSNADAVINITNDLVAIPTAAADIINGLIYFKFVGSDTVNLVSKKYYYDITITDTNSNVFSIRRGDFYVVSNIHNP